jgi:hypothetical protein
MFVETGLQLWNDHVTKNPGDLEFYDGVGNHYVIAADLLKRAIDAVRAERSVPGSQTDVIRNLEDEFIGGILSINRMDWEPPYAVDRLFCATNNLLSLYTGALAPEAEEPRLNLVINQAADALMTGKVKTLDELNAVIEMIKTNYRKPPGAGGR